MTRPRGPDPRLVFETMALVIALSALAVGALWALAHLLVGAGVLLRWLL